MNRTSPRYLPILLILSALLLIEPTAAAAHPADEYFQSHRLEVAPDGLGLEWTISTGPLLSTVVWNEADQNQDGLVDGSEPQSWAEAVLAYLSTTLDDNTPLTWQIEAVDWPDSFSAMQLGDEQIVLKLTAAWPEGSGGDHRLLFHNHYQEELSTAWFFLNALDGAGFRPPQQQNGRLELDFSLPEASQAGELVRTHVDEVLLTAWDTGTPALSAVSAIEATEAGEMAPNTAASEPSLSALPEDNSPSKILMGLVRTTDFSFSFFIIALGTAMVLGALHALTPGHGKTVVAAYLVGTKGTALHAISLGSIVTLTHTGSVFLLGLVTLAASRYILPTSLFPVLEIISGLLIVGLGGGLLYQRWRDWRTGRAHHHHDHDHHPHDHDHHHHHHIPDTLTWRSLITLGISGGLVPCPDAIAILLVAVVINRIALGLSLIVAFSLGLALVLIVIGLAMVHSRRLFDKMDAFSRFAPAMPVISAIIVFILGIGLTVSALIGTGVFGQAENQAVAAELSANVGQESVVVADQPPAAAAPHDQATILYLAQEPESTKKQLFLTDPEGATPRPLTAEPFGVSNYALSPDGVQIVYTALKAEGGSELWLVNSDSLEKRRLLACAEAPCSGASWSPDGRRLIYERGLSTLWRLDVDSGETKPIFQDSELPGFNARWSPDGQWLSYVSPANSGLQIYNLADGRSHLLTSRTGAPALWQPGGASLLLTDVQPHGERFLSQLFRFDLASETTINLSEPSQTAVDEFVEDTWAAWSPDGSRIAVVRKVFSDLDAPLGNQIWLIQPDGGEAEPLTHETEKLYRAPVWSPDGQSLLVPRYDLATETPTPGLWLFDTGSGEGREIVPQGDQPRWLIGD